MERLVSRLMSFGPDKQCKKSKARSLKRQRRILKQIKRALKLALKEYGTKY